MTDKPERTSRLLRGVHKTLTGLHPAFESVLAAVGNQQKLIVGRELAKDPAIIVASQPTRGLDIGAAKYIRDLLVEMRDAGRAILLVSADLDEVLALSDRVAIMYEGEFMTVCPPEELNRERVGLLMGGVSEKEAVS